MKTSERQAFSTFKDTKENFENSKQTRLINPTKGELGKVSKQILEKIVGKVKAQTRYLQWMNTVSVIQWFKKLEDKKSYSFINFDIVNFYPSITENLLKNAINWAATLVPISDDEKEIIFHVRQNFLFYNGQPWVKKGDVNFDVPMGAYDSAECCDLVGLYILHQLQNLGIMIGLYRDDGLAVSKLNAQQTERVKKDIQKIFNDNNLKITITANMKVVDFLDVTFNLNDETYKPYNKPNNKPLYVNAQSNHPPTILQNIPKMVNKRLSTLSSSKEMFDSSAKIYQEALTSSGYEHKLEYEEQDVESMNKKKNKRKRYKNEFWINPPYSMNVATNVGKEIFKALDSEIGPNNLLHGTFNRHTVRLSYSCMPNMQKKISIHNSKVYSEKQKEKENNQQQQGQQQQQGRQQQQRQQQQQGQQQQGQQQQGQQQQQRQQGQQQQRQQQQRQQPRQQQQNKAKKPCNCRGGPANCPLGGKCLAEQSIVYSCKVTRHDDLSSETYTGLTKGTFKGRLYGHNHDFRHRKKENSTTLSKYVWYLKDNHVNHSFEWKVLGRAKSFNPVTGKCRLCLLEKYFIMFNQKDATLNSRDEIFVPCKHKASHLLSNTKT